MPMGPPPGLVPPESVEEKRDSPVEKKSTAPKKTRVCRDWRRTGKCRFGDKCKFAHVDAAEKKPEDHPEGKAARKAANGEKQPSKEKKRPLCRYYAAGKTCKFGDKCRYRHERVEKKQDDAREQEKEVMSTRLDISDKERVVKLVPKGWTSEEEFMRLERFYRNAGYKKSKGDGFIRVDLVIFCSDPDFNKMLYTPEGIPVAVLMPPFYTEKGEYSEGLLLIVTKVSAKIPKAVRILLPEIFDNYCRAVEAPVSVFKALQAVEKYIPSVFEAAEKKREIGALTNVQWIDSEKERLVEALEKYLDVDVEDGKWEKISQYVVSRGVEECRAKFITMRQNLLREQEEYEREEEESDDDDDDDNSVDSSSEIDTTDENAGQGFGGPENSDESLTESEPEEPGAFTVDDVKRIGVVVKQPLTSMAGISIATCRSCEIIIACNRCRKMRPTVVDFGESNEQRVVRTTGKCQTCSLTNNIFAVVEPMFPGSDYTLFRAITESCTILQVVECTLEIRCEECDKAIQARHLRSGYRKQDNCQDCHEKMNLGVGQPSVPKPEHFIVAPVVKKQQKKKLTEDPRIVPGKPLPKNGTCKHYRHSYRWLRFPCCGMAYPCDQCHDAAWPDHQANFGPGPCRKCGKPLNKIRTSHWEGGEGCRNTSAMSKNDKKKYAGKNKTISRKAAAAIMAGGKKK
ncbi:hypothetical protein FOZ61_005350 [Perkinsus olseni]|uniref:Uncharacterized protein n=1 Tax=Perkinsus olseni TaxID=32597 RepID=A0A7J6MHS6_PEROL|nr:hypothetical protein FOZ61_005350 [Perkinsus olseni]KAF4676619.1 hypothetical protein FOL46_000083 [Perkinsus olseni]